MCSMSDRFLQHVNLVAMPNVSHMGFNLIFTAMLKRYMSGMTTLSPSLLPALVEATMDLYRMVMQVGRPTVALEPRVGQMLF